MLHFCHMLFECQDVGHLLDKLLYLNADLKICATVYKFKETPLHTDI